MTRRTITRRALLTAGAATLALTATACGSSGPGGASGAGGGGGGDGLQLWTLQNEGINAVQQAAVDRFNEASDGTDITMTTYVNDPYKAKLQTAIGSPNAPDMFYNWGGGNLRQYVEADQVHPLGESLDAEVRDKFLPSVLEVGTIDGEIYGVPMQGVQPVSFFYNKDAFAKAGIDAPPATWEELLAAIDKLKAAGIQPIALAGSQGWTELMYVEYLVDRLGGEQVFERIAAGEADAWGDPAVVEAMTMIQELVDRGAFGTNYAAVNFDNQGSQALLATGKAAMELMGAWEVTGLNDSFPEFIEAGKLGWADFPTVEGGTGDPDNIVGNPSNFYSVSARSADVDAATEFLTTELVSDEYVQGMLDAGQVMPITGIEDKVDDGEFGEFNAFTYAQVQEAPAFTQSWDQALAPDISQTMLTNIQQVFNKQMTPQEFADAMQAAAK